MLRDDCDPRVRQAEAEALMKALQSRTDQSPEHALLLRALELKYGSKAEEE